MLTTRYHLDEAHLSHYDEKLKSWASSQPVKTLPSTLYPWTLSEKAGAVTCWPVGGTELKPTVDFLFTETGPASGTKGPDNPSTITGVSSITVTRCETVGVDSIDYPLPLGGTYFGGTLDVASGVMTVTYGVKVLDGTGINWGIAVMQNHKSFYTVQDICIGRKSGNVIDASCSHFIQLLSSSADTVGFGFYSTSSGVYFFYGDTNTTKEDFNIFLASEYANGTPVTIAYELATPLTVQLTPTEILSLTQADKYTPRLNTVYTDASAVQVGYVKSPIREEFELRQAIVAQGGNV